MKRVLITGSNSYVGNKFTEWLEKSTGEYSINSICLKNDFWKDKDFSAYDVVIHVAGIAHIRETKENADLYYKVNRDLAFEVAKKAKSEGIKQFIFFSSMSVYGIETGIIYKDSLPKPKSNYGKSKLQAEELITTLEDESFKVVILRPPMIYGQGCKGNYTRLANLAVKTPVFPKIDNKRSMLFIDNLCEFLRLLIEDSKTGIFHPQNIEYVSTSEMVRKIAEANGKNIKIVNFFNDFFLRFIKNKTVNKVFGNLVYDMQIDECNIKYTVCDFDTSIRLTEK